MKEGSKYTFAELEAWLKEQDGTCLIVLDIKNNQRAFMHTFGGNFCGDWLSGDGILFYDDNEQHSANPHDEFTVIEILRLST